jgi:hypothetical protein
MGGVVQAGGRVMDGGHLARHCKTCGKPLVRNHRYTSDGKPNGREPLEHFLARETCGRKCQTRGGKAPWRADEKAVLRALYPFFPAPMIAKALGKGLMAVRRMAEFEGARKTARGRSNAASYAQKRRHERAAA